MKTIFKTAFLLSALSFTVVSCSKKSDPEPTGTTPQDTTAKNGEVGIEIANYVGDQKLSFDSTYTLNGGQQIKVSKFNYYISNVKLQRADGAEFVEEESYHFVTADKVSSGHFHFEKVPAGSYKSMTFMIGVDSLRNVSGAQTGALDPANGNFWTWNTGYIMAKLEGQSPMAGRITWHIGGFKGEYNSLRTVTLTFDNPVNVTASSETTINLKADMKKWFEPNNVSFGTASEIMTPSETSKKIADNYANMFSIIK